jgi:hypothetical protein
MRKNALSAAPRDIVSDENGRHSGLDLESRRRDWMPDFAGMTQKQTDNPFR